MAALEELFAQGATKIRRKNWNKHAHIVLPVVALPDGERCLGPWAKLRDISGSTNNPIFERTLLITDIEGDIWEPWEEIPWPWDSQTTAAGNSEVEAT